MNVLLEAAKAAQAALPEGNPKEWIAGIQRQYSPFDPETDKALIYAGLHVILLSPDQVRAWIDTCPVRSSCFPEWGMAPAN